MRKCVHLVRTFGILDFSFRGALRTLQPGAIALAKQLTPALAMDREAVGTLPWILATAADGAGDEVVLDLLHRFVQKRVDSGLPRYPPDVLL